MHILGILFLVLMIGNLLSPLESVGTWLYDRQYRGDERTTEDA